MSALEALPPKRRAPGSRWWGGIAAGGADAKPRIVVRWPRIFAVLGALALVGWLGLATALWGFYRFKREIPAVAWGDVAAARFHRVQETIGAHYFTQARAAWDAKEYARAVMLARAAVRKAPANLEARLFLAGVWAQVRRPAEALQTLREGLPSDAGDARLQRAFVETALANGRHAEVLRWLREELPARGARPLAGGATEFLLAELRAVLETAGAAEAERLAGQRPALADEPAAAPLLARLDFEAGRMDAGFARVRAARERRPELPELHEAVIDAAQRLQRADLARDAAAAFYARFPESLPAHLRFLEANDPAAQLDESRWTTETLRFLVRYRRNPAALERLADLAARRGWSDLAYLLYQNSLQETLGSYPFALHYVGALTKKGDYAAAERVLRQLAAERSSPYAAAAPVVAYLSAMVEWGLGRETEAQRHLDRLRLEVGHDERRLQGYVQIFRALGFAPLAEQLTAKAAAGT